MFVTEIDPITTEVIRNAFISVAKEMNANLIRGAYSPIIYEMKDCSVGIFNEKAEALGHSPGLPVFLGTLGVAIEVTTKKYGLEAYQEGDVYIINDCYLTGSHLNDVVIFSPTFYQANLVGFAATMAHWIDIGAMEPGQTNHATEIYQEGYRLGPTKLVEAGKIREDVVDFLTRNSRLPKQIYGDMQAMIAACRTGEKRFAEIIEKMGLETIKNATDSIFKQCEVLDRKAVRAISDGEYEAQGCMDNDGQSDDPVPVKVKISINKDNMVIDLSGSSPQVKGCLNCGLPQTISACRLAFKFIINPDMPVTGGTFAPLTVKVPEASIFAAQEPAPCQYYYPHLGLLIDLILQALSSAIPDKVIAGQCADPMNIMFTGFDARKGIPFISGEATAVGWGASDSDDGVNGTINYGGGDLKNFPAEVMENRYPIKILGYGLEQDSGGAGKYRGGLAVFREYETLSDVKLSLWFERTKTPGLGLFGGKNGAIPKVVINPGELNENSMLKVSSQPVSAGTKVRIRTGGGGGYGPPTKRDKERISQDVLDGYISYEAATKEYGLTGKELEIG